MKIWKKVDFICSISEGIRIGVSVTRAMGFPSSDDFTQTQAFKLLNKKINGLVIARQGICERQQYDCSILHI